MNRCFLISAIRPDRWRRCAVLVALGAVARTARRPKSMRSMPQKMSPEDVQSYFRSSPLRSPDSCCNGALHPLLEKRANTADLSIDLHEISRLPEANLVGKRRTLSAG